MDDLADRLARADDRTLDHLLLLHLFGYSDGWWTDDRAGKVTPEGYRVTRSPGYASTPSGALAVIEAMGEKIFSKRNRFADALRQQVKTESGALVAWPDALFILAKEGRFPRAVAEAALLALHASGALPAAALALTTETDE